MIVGEKLSLIYDLGKDIESIAVKNVSLTIEEGKFYGILGPSGSGKSSLLYLLSALKKPTHGKVTFNGQDLSKLRENEFADLRKKNFSFVFQKHFLIDYLTALENVLMPINSNKKEDIEFAKEILYSLNLEKHAHKKPAQLSGGQRQRVAIARALITKPKVIFGDEITASLDHKTAYEVMDILKNYESKPTLVMVTHDESTLKGVHKIFRMWDGELVI